MEKNTPFRASSQSDFMANANSLLEVPQSIVKIAKKFGLSCGIRIAINRLRFRVMCRVLYSIDLLRTCQIHYNQLKASKVLRWIILKSMTSYRLSILISGIENHYRPENSVKTVSPRSSKLFQEMLKKQNNFVSF